MLNFSRFVYLVLVLIPYGIEQSAYWKYVTRRNQPAETSVTRTVVNSYGWGWIWDGLHLVVLVWAGYRCWFVTGSLTLGEWLGIAGFVIGVGLRVWGLRELSPMYDGGIAMRSDHVLIQSGPFRFIRHPLHLGTVTQIVGLSLLTPWWLTGIVTPIALVIALYRNRTEDQLHLLRFGAGFQEYYRRTWDWVDWVFWK